MATIINSQLTTGFMSGLTNSAHDEFVNAVYNYLTATDSPAAALPESEPYSKALADFKATKESEHKAFMLTKKDYASEDMKKASRVVSSLMTSLRYALKGFSTMPKNDANKRKAQELYQTIVTVKYKGGDSYKQKNAKVAGVLSELSKDKESLKAFGMDVITTQLETANNDLSTCISNRRTWKTNYRASEKMKEARKKTQAALQALFDVIVSRSTIEPQIELTTIVNWLESSIADMRKTQKQKEDGNAKTNKATSGTEKPVTKTESGDDKKGTSDTSKTASQEEKSDEKNGSGTKTVESAATTDESGTKSNENSPTTDGSGTKSNEN